MGGFQDKPGRIAGQHDRSGAEVQFVVGPDEALQQPAAEKAGAAGDKEALAAQVVPEKAGVLQDKVQIGG